MARESSKLCRGFNSPLLNCSGKKVVSEFHDSWSDFDDGKMCYCKQCCEKIFQHYLKEIGNLKSALYFTCSKVDVPFREEIYTTLEKRVQSSKDNGRNMNITFGIYVGELKKHISKKEIFKDFSATNFDIKEIESSTKTVEDKAQELKEYKLKWGNQECIEDYEFLENTYERYTNDIDELSVQQQDLYRDLCRDRLLLRKLAENGGKDNDMITKVQNRVNSLMKTLKIDNFKEVKKKTDIERIIERQIWEIENTEPAEMVDKEEYKDYLSLGNDWGQGILRCVKNLLVGSKEYPNITRENSDKY